MNVDTLLARLKEHNVEVQSDELDTDGKRVVTFGCALPLFPYGGRWRWYTLVFSPGETNVHRLEMEAIRRHLCHLTTDLFGEGEAFYLDDDE